MKFNRRNKNANNKNYYVVIRFSEALHQQNMYHIVLNYGRSCINVWSPLVAGGYYTQHHNNGFCIKARSQMNT